MQLPFPPLVLPNKEDLLWTFSVFLWVADVIHGEKIARGFRSPHFCIPRGLTHFHHCTLSQPSPILPPPQLNSFYQCPAAASCPGEWVNASLPPGACLSQHSGPCTLSAPKVSRTVVNCYLSNFTHYKVHSEALLRSFYPSASLAGNWNASAFSWQSLYQE